MQSNNIKFLINSNINISGSFNKPIFDRLSKLSRNCIGIAFVGSMIGLEELEQPSLPFRCKTKTKP